MEEFKIIIELAIPGKPLGKQRPRVTKAGITYTPARTVSYETLVKELYIMQHYGKQLEGPLKMTIKAYFPIPKSASRKKHVDMLNGVERPTKKPDTDNVAKIIGDALNQLAYQDDSQIVEQTVTKYYSEQPRVEVEIEEVQP